MRHLKILVALRTNIFQELNFGVRGGGQEEKLRALILEVKWSRADLTRLLDERIRAATASEESPIERFSAYLPSVNNRMGDPLAYMLDRTLLRPRDAISFANECLRVGLGKARASWDDIKRAEVTYSSKRLLALRDEWKPTYPGIDRLLEAFRKASARMTREDVEARLNEICLLLADDKFPGIKWLTPIVSPVWSAGPGASWAQMYQPLLTLLYGIGLIGISGRGSATPVFHGDDPDYVKRESNIDGAQFFYIHRTFHAGLEVQPLRASKVDIAGAD